MQETGNKKKYTHRLSIRHHADGFSLYIYNVLNGELLQREDVSANASSMLETLEQSLTRPRIMDLHFGEVEWVSELPCTLLPLDEFRKNEVLSLYRFNFPTMSYVAADIRCEVLSALEVVVLYSVPVAVEQLLQRLFMQVQLRSTMGVSLEYFSALKHKKKSTLHFYVQVYDHTMIVCSFKQRRLQFACTYPVTNDADRIYYLLSVWKSMDVDAHTPCTLSGATKELSAEIRKFIATVTDE